MRFVGDADGKKCNKDRGPTFRFQDGVMSLIGSERLPNQKAKQYAPAEWNGMQTFKLEEWQKGVHCLQDPSVGLTRAPCCLDLRSARQHGSVKWYRPATPRFQGPGLFSAPLPSFRKSSRRPTLKFCMIFALLFIENVRHRSPDSSFYRASARARRKRWRSHTAASCLAVRTSQSQTKRPRLSEDRTPPFRDAH